MVSETEQRWRVGLLRCTVFQSPNATLEDPNAWWEHVAGTGPAEVQSRPRERIHALSGPHLGGQLGLTVQPLRVDWNLIPTDETDTEGFPVVGGLEVLDAFEACMAEWLAQAPVLRRVAFGAILYEPVNQRSDAYRRLADFVPGLTIDAATSRDFLYQINKPRVSKVVQGLDINRLSKWSAALRRPVSMELALGVDQPNVLTKMTAPGANAVRLELDINTALEFGAELPADSRGALFRELAALGREIAQHGDIA